MVPLAQVFPFGSVPLKTYIPDGDIDLTAFCDSHHSEDRLIQDILRILEREEKNQDAQFQVKEVKYIEAKVRASSFLRILINYLHAKFMHISVLSFCISYCCLMAGEDYQVFSRKLCS